MTRRQLALVAILSLVATVTVLAVGTGTPSPSPVAAARLAALRRPVVVRAAAAAAPKPSAVSAAPTIATAATPARAVAATAAAPRVASSRPGAAVVSQRRASAPATKTKATGPPSSKAGHVIVIALRGTSYDHAFGPSSAAPYLARTLAPRGVRLAGFRPLDAADLPNYIAMTGGQPPNGATRSECPTFSEFGADAAVRDDGVVSGDGCVYPNSVVTIGDQLTSSRRSWRAYLGDMPAGTCQHPESDGADQTLQPAATYATRHNPFVYFHSLLDLGDCAADDVGLEQLTADLATSAKTPDYAFIAPGLCDDGTSVPCADGRPGGLPAADVFLRQWIPRIQRSAAYQHDGAIIITFLSSPGTSGGPPPVTGALVLSRFAKRGATIATPYDPYALLRSLEDLFGLAPLARARNAPSFAKAALPGAF